MNKMEKWESDVDNIDWREMRSEVDRALMENLAAELGFPDFDHLEQASELVVEEYYVTHLSDDRWVWWNPQRYANEDPIYFADGESIKKYIVDFLGLGEQQEAQLEEGLNDVVQTRSCRHCEHEFNPLELQEIHPEAENSPYCSPECAMESIMGEIKEDEQ